jgi:hypothetical protein
MQSEGERRDDAFEECYRHENTVCADARYYELSRRVPEGEEGKVRGVVYSRALVVLIYLV